MKQLGIGVFHINTTQKHTQVEIAYLLGAIFGCGLICIWCASECLLQQLSTVCRLNQNPSSQISYAYGNTAIIFRGIIVNIIS